MDPQQWLEAATLAFNLIGMVVCLVGLTLTRRWPGYTLAGVGFLIATLPMLSQLVLMFSQ
ncbi:MULTISPECIES: hypothetical protein [unclassified Halomonas]|uniref:hypothetical protein n=1 Tax=unclassified Halomonas TaxID=2609666 RepID=UPI0004888052|nr:MULTISPECIES: hypothetical protein [unclassified Halomonas]PKH63417.1 hypothetical protein CXF94_01130 [Halomonas sp. Choline-3u-9]QGQ69872.1 hypothetical protein FDY98_06910 [Halomonas sp. PA16-9]